MISVILARHLRQPYGHKTLVITQVQCIHTYGTGILVLLTSLGKYNSSVTEKVFVGVGGVSVK